jgi:hypothetical protein
MVRLKITGSTVRFRPWAPRKLLITKRYRAWPSRRIGLENPFGEHLGSIAANRLAGPEDLKAAIAGCYRRPGLRTEADSGGPWHQPAGLPSILTPVTRFQRAAARFSREIRQSPSAATRLPNKSSSGPSAAVIGPGETVAPSSNTRSRTLIEGSNRSRASPSAVETRRYRTPSGAQTSARTTPRGTCAARFLLLLPLHSTSLLPTAISRGFSEAETFCRR